MNLKHIITILGIVTGPGAYAADLVVGTTSSDLGKSCYNGTGAAWARLIACNTKGADPQNTLRPCPSSTTTAAQAIDCYVGDVGDIYYFCANVSLAHEACGFCEFADEFTSNWKSYKDHTMYYTHYTISDSFEGSNWTCTPTFNEINYWGCEAGYYSSNTTVGSATMMCVQCPDNGTSRTGNVLKTGCYIPSGTAFSDSTGSGTYTNNCNWTE